MTVCNLAFDACYSCISSGMTLVQLQNKRSYCCIKDAATFLRPIELTYSSLSQCSGGDLAKWIIGGSVGAACVLALIVVIAVLCIWCGKRRAHAQLDEEMGLLGMRRMDYGLNIPADQVVNESGLGAYGDFELVPLQEVVVEGARRLGDNQKPTFSSFKGNHLKTVV